jgi:hypothetical protein
MLHQGVAEASVVVRQPGRKPVEKALVEFDAVPQVAADAMRLEALRASVVVGVRERLEQIHRLIE